MPPTLNHDPKPLLRPGGWVGGHKIKRIMTPGHAAAFFFQVLGFGRIGVARSGVHGLESPGVLKLLGFGVYAKFLKTRPLAARIWTNSNEMPDSFGTP